MGRHATGSLSLHGNSYRVRMQIAPRLRPMFDGKSHLITVLDTDSLTFAQRAKPRVVTKMRELIEAAECQFKLRARGEPADVQMSIALKWHEQDIEQQEEIRVGKRPVWARIAPQMAPMAADMPEQRGEAWLAVLGGKATPIESQVAGWLAQHTHKVRQKADAARAIKKLSSFLFAKRLPTTVEHLTRRMVGDYVSERVRQSHHWRSINKDLSFCSSLFRHLMRRGIIDANPFGLQSLPKLKTRSKRAWTKKELKQLLSGHCSRWMKDAIKILALSGMRANELASLQVRHCQKGVFQILDAKGGQNRVVPIHSQLLKLVRARCHGKEPEDFLFHEFPTPKNPKIERSQFLTKQFLRYRRSLKLEELNGGRQSAVDLHSIRRYFISQADVAGQRREDIERVVGHRPQGLSLSLYADSMSVKQMRKVVESVRLPR